MNYIVHLVHYVIDFDYNFWINYIYIINYITVEHS
jgi:hypothetical protein